MTKRKSSLTLTDVDTGSTTSVAMNGVSGEKAEKPARVKKEKAKFSRIMFAFTQSTTCHGVRYIWQKGSFLFRRGFWLIAFLVAVCVLVVQVVDRISYFNSNPYNVKVEVNFNRSMMFPVIAICNQNEFKITEAVKTGRKALIDDLYGQKLNVTRLLEKCNECDTKPCHCTMGNTTLDQVYFELAHKKEDMIVSCKWNRIDCGPDDFQEILTDHGVCFEFNGGRRDGEEPRLASGAGTENGLRLVINIEQYEYMLGEHDSAGLKILLYSNKEVPMVTYLGQGVAPGTRTFVGSTVTVMDRLPLPHGNCTRRENLKYYRQYSEMACKKDCQAEDFIEKCGCRQSSLWESDTIPICTIKETLQCYDKYKNHFMPTIGISTEHELKKNCTCNSPCHSVFYQPNFSYLKTANYDVDKNLAELDHASLLQRFSTARDTVSATDRRILAKDLSLLRAVVAASDQVKDVLYSEHDFGGIDFVSRCRRFSQMSYANVVDHFAELFTANITVFFKRRLLVAEEYFARGVQIMKEKYLDEISADIASIVGDVTSDVTYIVDTTDSGDSVFRESMRKKWREDALGRITRKQTLISDSLSELQRCILGYQNGNTLLPLPPAAQMKAMGMIPIEVLNAAVTSAKAKKYLIDLTKSLHSINETLKTLSGIVEKAFKDRTYSADVLESSGKNLIQQAGDFHTLQIRVVKGVFYKVVRECKTTYKKYKDKLRYFDDEGVRLDLFEPCDIIIRSAEVQKPRWLEYNKTLSLARSYIATQTPGKTSLVERFTSKDMTLTIAGFDEYLKTGKLQLKSQVSRYRKFLRIYTNSVLRPLVEELKGLPDDIQETALRKAMHLPCISRWDDAKTCNAFYDEYFNMPKKAVDDYLNITIGDKDTLLVDAVEKLTEHFTAYAETGHIDANFYRDNFLSLDVFFREMSYELIEQQPAYDQYALISDIGGSMGLFVGASVLTLCELLDAITLYIYKRFVKKDAVATYNHSNGKHKEKHAEAETKY